MSDPGTSDPGMSDPGRSGRPGLARRFLSHYREREMWLARTIWRDIATEDDARHYFYYARRAAFFAIVLRVVYVIHPPGFEDADIFTFDALIEPLNLAFLAAYIYLFLDGHRLWRVTLGFMAFFALDILYVLPSTTGGLSLLQVVIGIYVLRCFLIGVRAGRWLARAGMAPKRA